MRNDVQIDPLAKFDANYISDTMYTEDINKKMRVPKRIRVGSPNEDELSSNSVTSLGGYWPKNMENNYNDERLDMKVPERIIVTGSGQHLGMSNHFFSKFIINRNFLLLRSDFG